VHRFYAPDIGPAGTAAPLPAEEAQHLIRVLRLSLGENIRVFDGRGREHAATVEALTKTEAIVRLGEAVPAAAESPVTITLAMALLKADKFDEVVRDATMLGVGRVQPIATSRTEVPAARTSRVDRWRRIAVSSAKQCGGAGSCRPVAERQAGRKHHTLSRVLRRRSRKARVSDGLTRLEPQHAHREPQRDWPDRANRGFLDVEYLRVLEHPSCHKA
jgi:hypothetical protein